MEDDDTPDTRVFVSGLPLSFTSNQLGAHFAGRYQITDAVVIPDRRIGFVGFRNYTLAKSAIKYFDKTYIRMSKISVQMAKAVEIERTSTLQAVPKSKQPNDGRLPRPTLQASNPSNGHTTSDTKSTHQSAFEPHVPALGANKRKREPSDYRLDGSSKPAVATSPPASDPDDRGDRDLKRARKKEKKEKKQLDVHNSKVDDLEESSEGHKENTPITLETKLKKKKAKAEAERDPREDRSAHTEMSKSTELETRLEMVKKKEETKKEKRKKEKKKDAGQSKQVTSSDSLTKGKDGDGDQGDKFSAGEIDQLGKDTDRRQQVDDATKGGVEPIYDNAFELPEQSADQKKQRRRDHDATSDNEWLRAKTNRVLDLVDETAPDITTADLSEPGERSNETVAEKEVEDAEQVNTTSTKLSGTPSTRSLPSSRRLFVRNLPYTVEESDIESLFSTYGHLDEVHLVRDKAGNSKGIAYVLFPDDLVANSAREELDGKSFQGRLLHILEASDRDSHKLDEYEISKLPLKKQKALKRRMEAGGSLFHWNSMYMNPNAVLSSIADRLGVAKADLIDVSSSDAAVKQAHAETHVIQETKAFLLSHGVNLDAFRHRERDEATLLVKNFPFGTTSEELRALFGPYGDISKLLLPPSGTIAILQYAQPGEGSQAMRHLAYRNLKGSVLYLERAPRNLFNDVKQSMVDMDSASEKLAANEEDSRSSNRDESASSTLFVRNLNFATTTSGLIQAFRPLSGFLSARVKTKIDPRRPEELLSMGFGFVEFSSKQHARSALAAMNGHRLDNHELLVQMSRKATDVAEEQRHKDNLKKSVAHKTKIIIKNLPFETTKKDVRALLGAYGQLRSVKVPQKFDHSTRGFAFADFVTAKEAESAMDALKDTHLLGRRLVLEFAEDESIDPEDEIRAIEGKVGRQTDLIHLNKMTGSTRKKFNLGAQDDLQ